jgi:hypothetical protein
MTIYHNYIPYFYIIQDVRNGMYYAGAKWAQDANPSNFMVEGGYETSSHTIKELIRQHGLSNFTIRKIRTFESGQEAYDYETRFLIKVNAKESPKFYNKHNNDHIFSYHDGRYKEKMLEIYGVSHPSHSNVIKEKIRTNNLEKYGVDNPMKLEFVKEKASETNLKRRGVKNPMQCETVKQTMKKNNMEKYGVENVFQTDWAKEKIIETNIKNIGVPYPQMSEECREKTKQTNMKNLGVENAMYSEDIKEKMRKNNLEKYGVENTFQADWAKEKAKETFSERYGVEHPMYSEEIKEKMRQTNREKYGVENTFQSEAAKAKIKARMDYLLSRPQLETIRKYQKKYKLTFGAGWVRKSDEFINNLLDNLKEKYGEL